MPAGRISNQGPVALRRPHPVLPSSPAAVVPPPPPAGMHLWVGGVDILGYLSDQLTMTDSGFSAIGVMKFRAEAAVGTLNLLNEQPVQLANGPTVYYSGQIKTATPVPELCTPGWRAYDVECQDPTILAGHDVISTELSSITDITDMTDRQLIALAFSTFGTKGIVIGTECQVLATSVPSTAFLGMTLAGFMNTLCGLTGGSWYVDFSLHLHYFVAESIFAPFAISDTPDNVTSFGYDQFSLARDTVDLHNSVFYIPGGGGTAVPTWYSDPVSIAAVAAACGDNGIRATSVTDQTITSQTVLDEAGAAFLLANAAKQIGSCTVFQVGLRAGMQVSITNANEGLSAAPFTITTVTMALVANSTPVYTIGFGNRPLDRLTSVIGSIANQAVPLLPQVGAAIANAVAVDFLAGIVRVQIVNSLPTDFTMFPGGSLVVLTTDRKIYTSTGSSWEHRVDGADLVADSVTAASIAAGAIMAEALGADALVISNAGPGAVAITIQDGSGNTIGSWDATNGIVIRDPAAPTLRWLQLASGLLRLTTDGGATYSTAISPYGIDAGAINFGAAQGGANVVPNPGFERAPNVAFTTVTITSTTDWTNDETANDNRTIASGSISVAAW
jgi:hypothetical protein